MKPTLGDTTSLFCPNCRKEHSFLCIEIALGDKTIGKEWIGEYCKYSFEIDNEDYAEAEE